MTDAETLHADLDALIGTTLHDRYEVVGLLGVGGMGAVFKARHTGLARDVALKVLHPEFARDAATVKRFEREATSASRLDHPNCVRVTDFGTTPAGTTYLVIELLDGNELLARMGEPWPPATMVAVARQILAGLEHAHHVGIVHRDLKPENVFVTTDFRGQELVKLVDFGIAKLLDEKGVEKLTRRGIVFGTPRYMSPEQAAGGKIDARTDLYAAGLIFYEMLAGRPPFVSNETAKLLRMQIMASPPPLPDTVPPALASIVTRLLEKSKGDRYDSARAVIAALDATQEAVGGAVAAPSLTAASVAPVLDGTTAASTAPTSALEQSFDDAGAPAPLGAAGPPAESSTAASEPSGVAWSPAAIPPVLPVRSGATVERDASMAALAGASVSASRGSTVPLVAAHVSDGAAPGSQLSAHDDRRRPGLIVVSVALVVCLVAVSALFAWGWWSDRAGPTNDGVAQDPDRTRSNAAAAGLEADPDLPSNNAAAELEPVDATPSGDATPDDATPSNTIEPSDGKPSDGKPSEGKPSDGRPSRGDKPSDGTKPSDQGSTEPTITPPTITPPIEPVPDDGTAPDTTPSPDDSTKKAKKKSKKKSKKQSKAEKDAAKEAEKAAKKGKGPPQ